MKALREACLSGRDSSRWVLGALLALALAPALRAVTSFAPEFAADTLRWGFFELILRSSLFSVAQAAASAFVAIGLGLTLGVLWGLDVVRFGERFFRGLGLFLFCLPGAAVATMWIDASRLGLPVPSQGFGALVGAHALVNAILIGMSLADRVRRWRRAGGEHVLAASATLGASSFAWLRAALSPLIANEVRLWAAPVFLWSWAAFSTLLMLSSGPSSSSPEVLLYFALQNDPDSTRIVLLALVQCALGIVVSKAALRGDDHPETLADLDAPARPVAVWRSAVPASLKLLGVSVKLLIVSLVGIELLWVLRSLGAASTDVRSLATDYVPALLSSLTVGAGAAAGAWFAHPYLVGAGGPFRRRFVVFGLGVTGTVWAALWVGGGLDLWVGDSRFGQLAAAALAVAFAGLPFQAYWIERRLRAVPAETLAAAATSGANVGAIEDEILRPLVKDVRARMSVLAFVAAFADLGASGIFLRDTETLALWARRLAGRYDFSAGAWSWLTMAVVTGLGIVVERRIQRNFAWNTLARDSNLSI